MIHNLYSTQTVFITAIYINLYNFCTIHIHCFRFQQLVYQFPQKETFQFFSEFSDVEVLYKNNFAQNTNFYTY